MGFGELVRCVNRSTKPLEATFDGQIITFEPGYVEDGSGRVVRAVDGYGAPVVQLLPPHVAAIAKSQLPVMGTQDPNEPRPDEYLIGIEKWPTGTKDDTSPIEQSDAIEIIDRSATGGDRAGAEVIAGKGRITKRGRAAVKTSTGIKGEYDD